MTIQAAPLLPDLLMLAAAAAVLCLAGAAVVSLALGRSARAIGIGCVAALVVGAYGAALLATGQASQPQQLAAGDTKCFDDWCAAMVSEHRATASDSLVVDVRLENRGRGRAMRSNGARAYLEVPGRAEVAPADSSGLHVLLQAGQRTDVELSFPAPAGASGVRFLVVEGTGGLGPGTFEIGGEGSPFHARAGWPLPAVGEAAR
jgi:hypothetical protein